MCASCKLVIQTTTPLMMWLMSSGAPDSVLPQPACSAELLWGPSQLTVCAFMVPGPVVQQVLMHQVSLCFHVVCFIELCFDALSFAFIWSCTPTVHFQVPMLVATVQLITAFVCLMRCLTPDFHFVPVAQLVHTYSRLGQFVGTICCVSTV